MSAQSHLSVVQFQDVLLASVPAHPSDGTINELQERTLSAIEGNGDVEGVILDIGPVDIMDSFFARTVAETVKMIELMGAHPVLVGMRPSVAITTTELGFTLGGVDTAIDTEAAMATIRAKTGGTDA